MKHCHVSPTPVQFKPVQVQSFLLVTADLHTIYVYTFQFSLSFTGAVLLNSEIVGTSTHPDNPCPGDRVVYTCTTTDGALAWSVGGTTVGTYLFSADDVGATRNDATLPGVIANLTAEDGRMLTSTLTIPPAGSVVANETNTSCADFAGISNSTVLHIIGDYVCYS